ncbi:SusC/RagA family TonB-linked outer membrane protein [Hymenobacter chitinivorans]|uniref:TonB-linked SusC/RagA family outer membrane protein n=1 Tax=Hymenobacter chitinivorans DSM 11115 TaxID=1121954 RepID=A0A2M9BRK8_9BACT|nr:SusC/RagA family TonB-linked outer membrane protein [Hymenobacter chitinivorans]PJJ60571.1 TonB-linked SusC/RagA family outer membrane protein [Hymenobacter chitinivorans DSM 11115]
MRKFTWLTFLLLLSLPGLGLAQTQPVTGKVTDAKGGSLPGVTVIVRGTQQGTSTDASGVYSIAAADTATLVFSSIGFTPQTIAVRSRRVIDVTLSENAQQLGEVVVTALNVARERKTLGYSVTEVKGETLTQARENNVANSLVGKVAGLNVNSTSGGAGSSSNVIIRGVSSLNQTNQPLYVINGVPVESQPSIANTGGQYDNSPDLGDAISNINPDDIESISVLKGAAASALYGYRAKAGVILITTKSAKNNEGIEFNSNYVAERIYNLTDWQYEYGQGANNIKPTTAAGAAQVGNSSWGGRLDGSNVVQFDGTLRPYVAQRDNLQNFYRTGSSWTNTLAFSKAFTGGSVRLSASNLTNKAVVPNSGLGRQTFNFVGTFDPFKHLTIDARANYILEQADNRPILADGAGNANFNVTFLPTSLDVRSLEPAVNADRTELQYNTGNPYNTNPYFAAYKFVNNTRRERLLSSVSARYAFENGLFLQGRVGRDGYTDRFTSVTPSGTAYLPTGKITELTTQFTDLNVDGLLGKTFEVGGDFAFTPNLGASYRRTKSEAFQNIGSDLAVFGVNTLGNAKNKSAQSFFSDQEVHSAYGSLEMAYRELLFVTATVRRDWFSTLATPGKDNKLYNTTPGVSASFVFSELVKPEFLSFGKIRAGYSEVSQATLPFQTQLSYAFLPTSLNGLPLGTISPDNVNIPNTGLRPSRATEIEVGTELAFVQNRVRLDLTFYKKNSKDEIVFAPASISSGYQGAVLNSGEMENKGVEMLLTVQPIRTTDFSWTSSFNAAYNKNTVLSLAAGQQQSVYATSRSGVGFVGQIVGQPYGQVLAYDYKYNPDGSIATTPNGVPARGELKSFGTAFHPWTEGWSNDFVYKRLSLGVLIDGKFGGKIFSATDYYGTLFGLHKRTLENREGTFGSDKIDAATYYSTLANNVSKDFVQNADFIKLRQVTLGYSFPSALFGNHIQRLTLSLVARNLAFLKRKTDNIDPEGNYNAFAQGLELGGVPPVRTFGLNLSARF